MQSASWAPLTAFAAALFTVWWLAKSRLSTLILDHPNPRSLHESPIPRTGGLGLHAGILVAIGVIAPGLPTPLWIALGVLLLVSFLDDARGIPAIWRLAAHLAVSGLFAAAILLPEYGPVAIAVSALAIAWMANLYNFMDGSDGLAGGMALIGFSCYGAAAWCAGSIEYALVNFSIAAAAAGFLVFNFYPARIFMGDAGAVPLGFLAAALGFIGCLQRDWTWWFPLLVFSPFIVDATVTLIKRLVRGERIWIAHRSHYYQRMVLAGWSHRRLAIVAGIVMLAAAGSALAALACGETGRWSIIFAWAAAYFLLALILERRLSSA